MADRSNHADDDRVPEDGGRQAERTPLLEWLAAGLGLILALGVLGFIGYHAIWGAESPPQVTVEVQQVRPFEGGYLVEIRARNRGGSTAAQVRIEAELRNGGRVVETGGTMFSFVPPDSERQGGLFFKRDPRGLRLDVRAAGYTRP